MHIITKKFIEDAPLMGTAANGREKRFNCPACGDTGGHLYYNVEKKLFHCFRCSISGKVQELSYPGLFNKTLNEFINNFQVPVENLNEDKKKPTIIKSLPVNDRIDTARSSNVDSNVIEAVNYLYKRGVTREEIKEFDIRISRETKGPYKHSVIFPMYDGEGRLEYFVCRKYVDSNLPKYINAPWEKTGVWFLDNDTTPVIVEGVLDAIAIYRLGFSAICLLGKKATGIQLKKIKDNIPTDKALIYLDDDAFKQAIQLLYELKVIGINSRILSLPKDAADLALENPSKLKKMLINAAVMLEEIQWKQ